MLGIVPLVLVCLYANAQMKNFPDSIRIEFPDHQSIVTLELRDVHEQKEVLTQFPSLLQSLSHELTNVLAAEELGIPKNVRVDFEKLSFLRFILKEITLAAEPKLVTISPSTVETIFRARNDTIRELLPPGWTFTFKSDVFMITMYAHTFQDLVSLSQTDFQHIIASLDKNEATQNTSRRGLTVRLISSGGAVQFEKVERRLPTDMLGLHAGAAVGLYNGNWYPELNFATALYFSSRLRESNQRIMLAYELKFFPATDAEGNIATSNNTFLNLSYSRNFARQTPRWTGLGVGYLVNSKGSIYAGRTMKFFLETDIGSQKLNIVPEFYLTNDLKDFSFGLKLNYRF